MDDQVIDEITDNYEAVDFIATLQKFVATAKEETDDPFPSLYLEDPDGNRFDTAQLIKRTLSDGSIVFDVKLSWKE